MNKRLTYLCECHGAACEWYVCSCVTRVNMWHIDELDGGEIPPAGCLMRSHNKMERADCLALR